MYDQSTLDSLLNCLQAERSRLGKQICKLKEAIARWRAAPEAEAVTQVGKSLFAIEQQFERHCSKEMRGSWLEDAVSLCPRLSPSATRLEKEQVAILQALRSTRERLLSDDNLECACDDLDDQLHTVVEKIHRYDASEDRLIADAYGHWVERDFEQSG